MYERTKGPWLIRTLHVRAYEEVMVDCWLVPGQKKLEKFLGLRSLRLIWLAWLAWCMACRAEYRDALAFKPDVVVINLGYNDVRHPVLQHYAMSHLPVVPPCACPTLCVSHLVAEGELQLQSKM